jgi:putative nucleotidyltransferase with HDIG domain
MPASFFDKIKLFKAAEIQPSRPSAEAGEEESRQPLLRRMVREPWPLLVATAVIVAVFLTRLPSKATITLAPGAVAPADVVAPFDLTIEDPDATAEKKAAAAAEVLPVYIIDANVFANTEERIRALFAEGRAWVAHPPGNQKPEALRTLLLDKHGVELELADVQTLIRLRFPADLEETLISLASKLFARGIMVSKNLLIHGEEEHGLVLLDHQRRERAVRVPDLLDIGESEHLFSDDLSRIEMPARSRAMLTHLGQIFLTANVTYNKIETERQKAAAADAVGTVTVSIKKDRVIVRKGDEVTPEALKIIDQYNQRIRHAASWGPGFAGYLLLYLFLFVALWAFLDRGDKRPQALRHFQMMAVTLLGSLVLYKAFLVLATIVSGALTTPVLSRPETYYLAFPLQVGALIFAFLLPDPVTLLYIILNSLTVGLLAGGDFLLTIFAFVGGLAAAYGVKLYRRRYRAATLRAGFIVVTAVNALLILVTHLVLKGTAGLDLSAAPTEMAMGVLGGAASAALAFLLLPLVESAFGFVTAAKLLELTNSDLPIFRQLAEEAPGSYHHSLTVASLAEKAAEAVGLDTQLVKAGALYHDIGKTKMPEYFIENRSRESDVHKDLAPSMSTLVIKNHVKEGVELARKLKLPRPLREIIEQHHGNSLVRYFFAKAKQTYDPEDQTVGEESFRYPGPPPQSKEAGLVMLADAIEAASRSLKAPTKDNLKRVITDIINGTLQDGQLDACDFSLRELRAVAAAFLTILYAIYHPRVEYPGFNFNSPPKNTKKALGPKKKDNDRHPQPSEKTPGPDESV